MFTLLDGVRLIRSPPGAGTGQLLARRQSPAARRSPAGAAPQLSRPAATASSTMSSSACLVRPYREATDRQAVCHIFARGMWDNYWALVRAALFTSWPARLGCALVPSAVAWLVSSQPLAVAAPATLLAAAVLPGAAAVLIHRVMDGYIRWAVQAVEEQYMPGHEWQCLGGTSSWGLCNPEAGPAAPALARALVTATAAVPLPAPFLPHSPSTDTCCLHALALAQPFTERRPVKDFNCLRHPWFSFLGG